MELNKIYNEDCMQGMRKLDNNSIQFIFSDPPYNLIGLDVFMDSRTYIGMARQRAKEYLRLVDYNGTVVICGRPPILAEIVLLMQEEGFIFTDWITWWKVDSITAKKDGYSKNYEVFAVFRRSPFSKFKHLPVPSKSGNYNANVNIGSIWKHCKISSQHKEGTKHPTQKPIKFLRRFIETFSDESDLILDPFMGSGTTAVACKELRRKYVGFEINPEYVNMANKRLETITEIQEKLKY
ncbi:site-specific DNA-methyltransferase [archaeon]|nr:site-specific DNA-methyltransferase [archaeon]